MFFVYLGLERTQTLQALFDALNRQTVGNNEEVILFLRAQAGMTETELDAAYRPFAVRFQ